jgi:hypothetical protein
MNWHLPHLGFGIGWRPELALLIDRRRDLGFVELTAEDCPAHGPLPTPIELLRRRGVQIVPHGVSLSLGGTEPLDGGRLDALANLAERVSAPLVSEHIAFVRGGGLETGHLLPLPRTREALELVVANTREAKAALPVPLALENIASVFEWPSPEMDEATFLTEVLERANVLLLLDLENVYANARNHGYDPLEFLARIPLKRIAYIHVAGGSERDGLYHDTHMHDVPPPVLGLLEEVCARVAVPGVMLERDDQYPPDARLNAELDAIAATMARGAARRTWCPRWWPGVKLRCRASPSGGGGPGAKAGDGHGARLANVGSSARAALSRALRSLCRVDPSTRQRRAAPGRTDFRTLAGGPRRAAGSQPP